jgi:anti-sigma factor (TIGR02949 family)
VICPESRERLHAHLDDELEPAGRAAFEDHLRGCPACSRELESQRALQTALREGDFRHAAPAGLRMRVRSALRAGATTRPRRPLAPWLAAAAALLIGVAAGSAGTYLTLPRDARGGMDLPRDLAAAHVRSLMADHLYDVASTDRHTVKPWFQGRLDFTLPVKDLKDHGYALEGGRLDYLDGRAVAALVYGRHKHVINLFVWPAEGGDSPPQAVTQRGFNLLHWTQGGLNFWGVSDLNAEELAEFTRLQRETP